MAFCNVMYPKKPRPSQAVDHPAVHSKGSNMIQRQGAGGSSKPPSTFS